MSDIHAVVTAYGSFVHVFLADFPLVCSIIVADYASVYLWFTLIGNHVLRELTWDPVLHGVLHRILHLRHYCDPPVSAGVLGLACVHTSRALCRHLSVYFGCITVLFPHELVSFTGA